ncbi:MAG: 4Fe-4S binding protein [Bacteroidia bacterium]|nr:4Fe-4S binding protein [Bacteroidia bacterium]
METFTYLKNVVTLKLNIEKCTGCGMCTIVCPHRVFEIANKKANIKDKDFCMECGACANNCPEEAIYVKTGVGCAAGVLAGLIKGTEPTCDCGTEKTTCC